jgi:hypothetical protein
MRNFLRTVQIAALVAMIGLAEAIAASAEPISGGSGFTPAPDVIAGKSPDGLGTWSIHYQRIDGGNPNVAAAINDGIGAEATRQVQRQTWDASTRRPWTFDATGTAYFHTISVSELFVGKYDTHEPNMPIDTVTSVVFDSRSGVPITWNNLFRDKSAGLGRLSEKTAAILPTIYAEPHPGYWLTSGAFAPLDINFKYWIPTDQGIELHFPDYQFGRGLKVVTVPWAQMADLIAPEFLPIMGVICAC